jgi:hypothetical protein
MGGTGDMTPISSDDDVDDDMMITIIRLLWRRIQKVPTMEGDEGTRMYTGRP